MRKTVISTAALIGLTLVARAHADEAEYQKIRQGMRKLAPLAGKWNAEWRFHDGEGVTEDVGTHTISFVLDDTYPEFQWEHHNKQDPKRYRKLISFVTFNP